MTAVPPIPLSPRDQSDLGDQRSPGQGLWSPSALSAHGESAWPTLGDAAFHGLAGRVVTTLGPHTEADPAGLLLCFLAAFGNVVGPDVRAVADAAPHPARFNVVLVGETSRARKGTAQANVNRVMALAAPEWFEARVMGGLASGEGLIATVREEDDTAVKMGAVAPDKRLLVVEPEFARVLAVAGRENSTLSMILRDAWDTGKLRVMTRKDPLVASGAHVSVIGHVTREELLRRLESVEVANGFANRFLFALVKRSKRLPEGGNLDPATLDDLAAQVKRAIEKAGWLRTLPRTDDARKLWAEAYDDFGEGTDGLAAAVTARAEAQVLRLSVAYAALDGVKKVDTCHLEAALAVWRYCETSAYLIFGEATGDPIADKLLDAVRAAGAAGMDGTQQRDLFGRHVSGNRLQLARDKLERRGLVKTEEELTGGRPRLVTRAVTEGASP